MRRVSIAQALAAMGALILMWSVFSYSQSFDESSGKLHPKFQIKELPEARECKKTACDCSQLQAKKTKERGYGVQKDEIRQPMLTMAPKLSEETNKMWNGIPLKNWERIPRGDMRKLGIFPSPMGGFRQKTRRCPSSSGCCIDLKSSPSLKMAGMHESTEQYLLSSIEEIFGSSNEKYTLTIEVDRELTFDEPPAGKNEGYSLFIGPENARLRAETTAGAVHGFWTFVAAFTDKSKKTPCLSNGPGGVPIFIRDSPRFQYRGLTIDAARSPHSLETLRESVDMAARVKFNVLHLRLSDDTGFVLRNNRIKGCKNCMADQLKQNPQTYSDTELKDLVNYAFARVVEKILFEILQKYFCEKEQVMM